MPIDYFIHHDQRLVVARGQGVLAGEDIFEYQRAVWPLPEVAGYDELIDMTAVEQIVAPSPAGPRMQQLACESAAMDHPEIATKFVIVAPDALAFGLGRQYQTHREADQNSKKEVRVVRTLKEALEFLGRESWEGPLFPPQSQE